MKILTFSHNGIVKAGFMAEDDIVSVCVSGDGADMAVRHLVESGTDIKKWANQEVERVALADIQVRAPMPELRRDIFCVGKNYRAHAAEFHSSGFDAGSSEEVPTAPVIFTKATTSVIGQGDEIRATLDPTETVDYEGELGVVIGKRAFQVSKADAYNYVFGYTIVNDVTSRQLQKKHNQWVIGKGLDTFAPMGPVVVTADEVGDVTDLELETWVNGELRQKVQVSDLIFDIPTLIETISATMTLLPGDVIATGTPVGVGIGFNPPRYLKAGDEVSVSISKIGTLSNPVA